MNSSHDSHKPESRGPDPEVLLRARLRETTPEFEARFDDLRRRLAQESQAGWLSRALDRFGMRAGRGAWTAAAAGVALACVVAAFLFSVDSGSRSLPADRETAFGQLIVLDDTLRDAMPLTDPETLEALLYLPVNSKG